MNSWNYVTHVISLIGFCKLENVTTALSPVAFLELHPLLPCLLQYYPKITIIERLQRSKTLRTIFWVSNKFKYERTS
jgi:hypothetical protein